MILQSVLFRLTSWIWFPPVHTMVIYRILGEGFERNGPSQSSSQFAPFFSSMAEILRQFHIEKETSNWIILGYLFDAIWARPFFESGKRYHLRPCFVLFLARNWLYQTTISPTFCVLQTNSHGFSLSHFGPWNKRSKFLFPTNCVIPKISRACRWWSYESSKHHPFFVGKKISSTKNHFGRYLQHPTTLLEFLKVLRSFAS